MDNVRVGKGAQRYEVEKRGARPGRRTAVDGRDEHALSQFCGMAEDKVEVRKKRRWRTVIGVLAVVLLLLGTTAFFLPYLLKRYIEKHSVEWIGRTVTIDRIILNPFTLTYAVNGVRCSERGSDQVFVSWRSIRVKANLWRGFRENDWRFHGVRIEDPYIHLMQQGDRFNFSDLLELGAGNGDSTAETDTVPTRFSMDDIRLTGGKIDYASDVLKAPVGISALHVACNRISSASARMDFILGLVVNGGGKLDGGFTIDTDAGQYDVDATLDGFALAQLLPYLQDFMHTTALKGALDLRLKLHDSWERNDALTVSGTMALDSMLVTDADGAPLMGLRKGRVILDTLVAATGNFKLNKVLLDGFSTRYQQWADGSNTWTKALKLDSAAAGDSTGAVLAAEPSNIFVMLADYIRMLGRDFVANQYTADTMRVTNGTVEFEDFTPEKPFRYTLSEVDITSSRIVSTAGTADFTASALLNGSGHLKSSFRFNPMDFHDVDADAQVDGLSLPDLDAYSRWYGAYPVQSGTLSYTGSTSIKAGKLDSKNHLTADQLRFGKKTDIHDTGIYVLPLRLAASLLRDVNGKIDLEIPITGDLNDPKFKPWPIVWKVLKNLVVKAAAAPVRLVAGALGGGDGADLDEVRFPALQTALGKEQRNALDALAGTLRQKPDLNAALIPVTDKREEGEVWAAQQVKMEYLGLKGPLSEADSNRVAGLSLRDSAFAAYLNQRTPTMAGKPERERCVAAVGAETVASAVGQEEQARQLAVQEYLVKAGVPAARFLFRTGSAEELAGHTGAPGFRFILDVAGQ
jgi:hypothetical protein